MPWNMRMRRQSSNKRRRAEGEIEVAHVLIDGSSSGETARERHTLVGEDVGAAFPECILVASDYNAASVLPEKEYQMAVLHILCEVLLKSQVFIYIGAPAPEQQKFFNHRPSI